MCNARVPQCSVGLYPSSYSTTMSGEYSFNRIRRKWFGNFRSFDLLGCFAYSIFFLATVSLFSSSATFWSFPLVWQKWTIPSHTLNQMFLHQKNLLWAIYSQTTLTLFLCDSYTEWNCCPLSWFECLIWCMFDVIKWLHCALPWHH